MTLRGLERAGAPEQAAGMTQDRTRTRTTQIALGGRVKPGDYVAVGDRCVEILRVRRAQGRKPSQGENLHLVSANEVIKINSLDGVRILARRA